MLFQSNLVFQVQDEAVFHVLDLVGLGIEDVGALSGDQRSLQRRIERFFLIPGYLDLGARVGLFKGPRRRLDEIHLGLLVSPVAPKGQGFG